MKQYVDLGLPSGIKWATCNVGADKPEGYGDYFAWGKFDPSYVDLDSVWRMPTIEEWRELHENCTWTWTTLNGVDGYEVKGANGNSIFLPAAGWRNFDGSMYDVVSDGGYWSSTPNASEHAWYLYFGSGIVDVSICWRYIGQSVRLVYVDSNPKKEEPYQEFNWNKVRPLKQEDSVKEMTDWAVIRKTCLYLEEITKCPVEITGSYILKKGGLIDRAPSDVDIRIAMDSTKFEHLCYLLQGKRAGDPDYDVNSFYIERGKVTLNLCLVQTLNTAFKWDEVNVTSYDHIIKWKLDHQREKDLKDLVIIKERLSKVDDCFKYQINTDTVNRLIAVVERYLSNEAKKSVQ